MSDNLKERLQNMIDMPQKKSKIRKSNNNNTKEDLVSKKQSVVVVDTFYDYGMHRKRPLTNLEIERIRKAMVDWSLEDDSLHLGMFFMKRGIGEITWRNWIEKFPEFARDYQQAKLNLGYRRHQLMLERKISEKSGMFIQGKYEKEWQEKESHLEKLAEKNAQTASNFLVQTLDAFKTKESEGEENK